MIIDVVYGAETLEKWRVMKAAKMSVMYIQLVIVVALTTSPSDVVAYHVIRNTNFTDAVHTGRYRRQAQLLTPKEKSEIVDHHNVLRALEGADNMEMMAWNDFLAEWAATWAAKCTWEHGDVKLEGNNLEYKKLGQNLYATTSTKLDLTAGIQAWYDEKAGYDYDTLGCSIDMCGHYTQVVWAKSVHVGCAVHQCQPLKKTTFAKAQYLVCNYGPPGNVRGKKPFTKGAACSKCGNGAGWCKNKLCNRDCSSAGKDCSCAAHCYNCAELDKGTCRCSCDDGWHGQDCSVPCEDTHEKCGVRPGKPGWPTSWCDKSHEMSVPVREGCPAMCKLCKTDPDAEAGHCELVLGPGAYPPVDEAAPTTFVMSQQMMMTFVMATIALATSMQ